MATDVKIPELGESVTEAILVEWLKEDGQSVEVDEPICVIETDKADAELPSPVSGTLKHLKSSGDTVAVGESVARVEDGGASTSSSPAPEQSGEAETSPPPASEGERGASGVDEKSHSPAVRRLLEEHGLDASKIAGTGRGGRLVKQDVVDYLERGEGEGEAGRGGEGETKQAIPASVAPVSDRRPASPDGVRREPMTRLRKRIAERLVTAQQTAAMLTTFNEVDMTSVMAVRKQYRDRFQEVHEVSLGLMSFFVRACVLALQEYPAVNAGIEDDDIVYHDYVHMGIAVSTERGLVVPVLRNAESMSFAQIESEIKRLAGAAREGKLGFDEMGGGTFTITNGGVFGSLVSTPILNPPQSGILGMHAIKPRPIAVGEEVVVRPMMYLALTYDHRIVDGKDSVTFLVRVKEFLEDPARMMLEV